MRRAHLASLAPFCPVCRSRGTTSPLGLAAVHREEGEHVIEGALRCQDPGCLSEFPILDGIPLLVANLRAYVAGSIDAIQARTDLAAETESLLGDCCGPSSAYDLTRQHLSTYAWDHWADLDPMEVPGDWRGSRKVPVDSPPFEVEFSSRGNGVPGRPSPSGAPPSWPPPIPTHHPAQGGG
ncbi:MAG TPA: hypothetical protein VMM92_10855, partial [Thermoanaerobaculia bacterium]|nr:hypothetical protein [Thermoanaerobaculia bacterium]